MYLSVCANIFKHLLPSLIEAKFHMEPPWDGGTKVCSNGPAHMTKMAVMPRYGKNLKKSSSPEPNTMTLKLGMQHWVLECYQNWPNDDPGLSLTYFTARSNLILYAFVWENSKTVDISETIVVYDIKVGRYSYLNKYMYMNLHEYQRSRSFIGNFKWSLRGMGNESLF